MSDYRGCRIIQCFLVQSNMVSVSQNMVGLERMLDYRGVGLQRFHCTFVFVCAYVRTYVYTYICTYSIRTYIRMYVQICTFTHMYVGMHKHSMHSCTYMRANTHMCTHTHAHTHTPSLVQMSNLAGAVDCCTGVDERSTRLKSSSMVDV